MVVALWRQKLASKGWIGPYLGHTMSTEQELWEFEPLSFKIQAFWLLAEANLDPGEYAELKSGSFTAGQLIELYEPQILTWLSTERPRFGPVYFQPQPLVG